MLNNKWFFGEGKYKFKWLPSFIWGKPGAPIIVNIRWLTFTFTMKANPDA